MGQLLEYYKTSWVGTSIAKLAFEFSETIGRASNSTLWYLKLAQIRNAIIGVSYQYLTNLIDQETYMAEFEQFRDLRLKFLSRKSDAGKDDRIEIESEFIFPLLKHWNVYESIYFSKSICSKLNVWQDSGRLFLDTLFAKIGIPLSQLKAEFTTMDMEFRETLPIQLNRYCKEMGLSSFKIPSFIRDFGFLGRMSAQDFVFSLSSLLFESRNHNNFGNDSFDNFFSSYNALRYIFFLTLSSCEIVKSGIIPAISHLSRIALESFRILSTKMIRVTSKFRYLMLKTQGEPYFKNIECLRSLGLYLLSAVSSVIC